MRGVVSSIAADPRAKVAGLRWHEVYQAGTARRCPPECFGYELPWQFVEHVVALEETHGVFEVPQARFWGRYGGFLLDREDRLLLEVSRDIWPAQAHTACLRWRWPEPELLRGTTAVLSTPEAQGNFWHWNTELLTRLHLILKAGWSLDRIDRFLVNDHLGTYRGESLRELGVPLEKVRVVGPGDDFRLEHALVPTFRSEHFDIPRWSAEFLRSSQPVGVWTGSRRLYVTRRGAAFRRLLNEHEIWPLFERAGFELFEPEKHPVAVQRAAFANAEAVVGPHGSGFTNALFSQRGARLVEFFPPNYVDLAFWVAAGHAGMRYGALLGRGRVPQCGDNPRARFADLTLDPDRARRVLEWIG